MAESKQPSAARHLRAPSHANTSLKQHATPQTNWAGPSNISTFVRVLRLLNLDQHGDWPNISVQTFSTKAGQQNLQYRIKCVEWALYRLFEIWDPDETTNKLRPFFPPLEPLQSLNLRAALFRSLSDLKKNGVLGREATLRKTMLDECKGDKFEEVLAGFAIAVLRTVVIRQRTLDGSAVGKLVFANSLDASARQTLLPLVLAHRVSVTKELEEKNDLRQLFQDFEKILQLKEAQVHKRSLIAAEQLKKRPPLEEEVEYQVQRAFRRSWQGDERWANVMLRGGHSGSLDPLLENPFEEVWDHVREGTIQDLQPSPSRSLLDDLEARISDQQARLNKWKDYQRSMSPPRQHDEPPRIVEEKKRSVFSFKEHQQLTLNAKTPSPPVSFDSLSSPSKQLYRGLIDSFHKELADLRPNRQFHQQHKRHTEPTAQLSRSSTSNLVKSPVRDGMKPLLLTRVSTDRPRDFSPGASLSPGAHGPHTDRSSGKIITSPIASSLNAAAPSPTMEPHTPPRSSSLARSKRNSYFETGHPSTPLAQHTFPDEPPSPASSHEAEASSPSRRSQVQRTQSMAQRRFPVAVSTQPRQTPEQAIFKKPEKPSSMDTSSSGATTVLPASNPSSSSFGPPLSPTPKDTEITKAEEIGPKGPPSTTSQLGATLLERTRQSMSLLPHTNNRARKSIAPEPARSRQYRQSQVFPTNQFETPGKQKHRNQETDSQSSTPREELFSQEADYASVFKSRPRIATSPNLSPSGKGQGLGAVEGGLGLEGMEDLSIGDITLTSSPLERGKSGLKGY